jgi:small GTP-binding protein
VSTSSPRSPSNEEDDSSSNIAAAHERTGDVNHKKKKDKKEKKEKKEKKGVLSRMVNAVDNATDKIETRLTRTFSLSRIEVPKLKLLSPRTATDGGVESPTSDRSANAAESPAREGETKEEKRQRKKLEKLEKERKRQEEKETKKRENDLRRGVLEKKASAASKGNSPRIPPVSNDSPPSPLQSPSREDREKRWAAEGVIQTIRSEQQKHTDLPPPDSDRLIHVNWPAPEVDIAATARISIVGPSGVGKTTLGIRLRDHVINKNKTAQSTVAIDLINTTVYYRGKYVRITLVDTAGQERFGALPSLMYRHVAAVIVVYSITDRESFLKVPTYLNQIEDECTRAGERAHNPLVMLIGNKTDLAYLRQVKIEEAKQVAASKRFHFYETSALEGYQVEDAFGAFIKDILDEKNMRDKLWPSLAHFYSAEVLAKKPDEKFGASLGKTELIIRGATPVPETTVVKLNSSTTTAKPAASGCRC